MPDERRKRVVSLIRVSTAKQVKDKDADYQRNMITLTCRTKGLDLVEEFALDAHSDDVDQSFRCDADQIGA